ncbi:MAG: hypothetical protein RL591_2497 [Planctomycetota bacterium]|jgi:predicted amidohydrolase
MDIAANRVAINAQVSELNPDAGDFILLPEMCETAWTSDSALCRAAFERDGWNSVAWLTDLARRTGCWVQAGLAQPVEGGKLANTVAVLSPEGVCKAIYRKNFLFPSERESYLHGTHLTLVDLGLVTICPLICYDLRFPELWRLAARAGAEVFTVSSSWPALRHEHWRALLVARAIENQAAVVASNRVGNDPSLQYSGGSVAIDHLGNRVHECGSELESASLGFDRGSFNEWRAKFGALRDTRASLLGSIEVTRC